MASTVRLRLNHYETLGVSPTAASDEIAQAFARQGNVYRAHAFGGLAELCIAYETLRDPIRRRAYDAAIGVKREPVASGAMTQAAAMRAAIAPASSPTLQPQRAFRLGPDVDSQVRPEPRIGRGDAPRLALEEELGVESRPIDWRRAGLALGSVVVAACALGGLAGWWTSGGVGEAVRPDNSVSVALPPAKPLAAQTVADIAAEPLPVLAAPKAPIARPKPVIAAPVPAEPSPIAAEPDAVAELPQGSEARPDLAEDSAAQGPAVSTPMPLPNRVVARTIERIGYSCGSVASTAPVEGEAAGVFKVTCSSGQIYQAKPVNGRYHFRRWGRR